MGHHQRPSAVFAASNCDQLPLRTRLVLYDITGNGAGPPRVKAGPIHLTRAAATGEVTVLRADGDLVRARRDARAGIDARPAAWLNHNRAGLPKDIQIALADAIFARPLGAELNIELAGVGHTLALFEREYCISK